MLLAAGTLAGCVPANQYAALQAEYTQLVSAYSVDQAQIQMLNGRLKVTFKDEILYPEGAYHLPPQSDAVLSKLVPVLSDLQNTQIVVDGYTDNVPIGPMLQREGIQSNLDLSSRRADGVVDYLRCQGVNPNLISAEGHGDTNPVASNDTPEGRSKNRRIEVTLVGPGT